MRKADSTKKQKLSLAQRYQHYLSKSPKPKSKLFNKYNLLDDVNTTDKAMRQELQNYIRTLSH